MREHIIESAPEANFVEPKILWSMVWCSPGLGGVWDGGAHHWEGSVLVSPPLGVSPIQVVEPKIEWSLVWWSLG